MRVVGNESESLPTPVDGDMVARHPKFAESAAFADAMRRIAELEARADHLKDALAGARIELDRIHASDGWKLLTIYYRLRNRLFPDGSIRQLVLTRLLSGGRRLCKLLPTAKRSAGPRAYLEWIARHEPGPAELDRQRQSRFARPIRFGIIASIATSAKTAHVEALVDSVLAQTFSSWQLCLSASLDVKPAPTRLLAACARRDTRIQVIARPVGSGETNPIELALRQPTTTHFIFLDDADTLAPFALYEAARVLDDEPRADFIYADEDRLDAAGQRHDYHFKPDWSPDLLRSHHYVGRPVILERRLLERLGTFPQLPGAAGDYDRALRVSEMAGCVLHIAKVLSHRQADSEIDTDPAQRQALADHLRRTGSDGTVEPGGAPGVHRVVRSLSSRPLVSIIIPTRDQQPVLACCLESIATSTYKHTEIILVENNSKLASTFDYYKRVTAEPGVRLLTWDRPFNYSALNNFAVPHAKGEIIVFLNNDTRIRSRDWLERMLEHALRPEVGAVGAKLFFPDNTIQHGGVILGIGGVAGHAHVNYPGCSPGYRNRLLAVQNVSAVTGACLMMRKQVFEEIGGFDETFMVAFNDVDLCLRLRQTGRWIVWVPGAELYHDEQKTRGRDSTAAKKALLTREMRRFMSKWWEVLERGDPFYSPHFSLEVADFTLRGD